MTGALANTVSKRYDGSIRIREWPKLCARFIQQFDFTLFQSDTKLYSTNVYRLRHYSKHNIAGQFLGRCCYSSNTPVPCLHGAAHGRNVQLHCRPAYYRGKQWWENKCLIVGLITYLYHPTRHPPLYTSIKLIIKKPLSYRLSMSVRVQILGPPNCVRGEAGYPWCGIPESIRIVGKWHSLVNHT